MPAPFIYIIIPNTNGHLYTIECLETVLKQNYQQFRVIVVDNSPGDNSCQKIVDWCEGKVTKIDTQFEQYVYPLVPKPVKHTLLYEDQLTPEAITDSVEQLIIIKAIDNNGFSAANNVGIKFALQRDDFDWIWLLNNDTVIAPDCLQAFADREPAFAPKTGIAGTKLYYYYSPESLQAIGGKFNKWLATTSHVGENENDEGQYDHVVFSDIADYTIGASMFVSKAFINDVGLMCEDYFFYFEEMDWTVRGRRKGWKVDFVPACKVYHKDGGTVPNQSKTKSVLSDVSAVRNRLLFARRFYPQYAPIAYSGLLAVIALRIKRMQFKRLGIILKAVLANTNPKKFIGVRD